MNASKGIHLAVGAAVRLCEEYSELRFEFVGLADTIDEYVGGLIAQIRSLGFASRIVFRPYVTDVRPVFANSDLHICPSLQEESSANVVIEAKQAGVPSVVFPKGGLPELVAHGVNGFVCDGCDVDSLVEGIRFFLISRSRLSDFGAAARASIAEYSPDTIGRLWADVFGMSRQLPA